MVQRRHFLDDQDMVVWLVARQFGRDVKIALLVVLLGLRHLLEDNLEIIDFVLEPDR